MIAAMTYAKDHADITTMASLEVKYSCKSTFKISPAEAPPYICLFVRSFSLTLMKLRTYILLSFYLLSKVKYDCTILSILY